MKAALALVLLLSACDRPPAQLAADPDPDTNRAEASPQPAASPFSTTVENPLYEFTFGWPAEAAAIPKLVRRFQGEMKKSKADLVAGAEEEKAMRAASGQDFNPHSSSTVYETAGQSPRLLSLQVDVGGYSGGAHGHFAVGALLWDRQAKRAIDIAELFAERANRDRLLTQRWCDALNKAREEKRGEILGGGGLFDDCPGLDDIAIIPTDSNQDGRFEKLLFVASPYVAGPWVEGAYEIELVVTPDMAAGLKSDFKPSFAAQGAQ